MLLVRLIRIKGTFWQTMAVKPWRFIQTSNKPSRPICRFSTESATHCVPVCVIQHTVRHADKSATTTESAQLLLPVQYVGYPPTKPIRCSGPPPPAARSTGSPSRFSSPWRLQSQRSSLSFHQAHILGVQKHSVGLILSDNGAQLMSIRKCQRGFPRRYFPLSQPIIKRITSASACTAFISSVMTFG